MTEDERGIDSRKDWIEFIDLRINLGQDRVNRHNNRFWFVLPLLVTVGWATLQFMYSAKVNLEIFAISLLFLSLFSMGTTIVAHLIPSSSEEPESSLTVDTKREMRVARLVLMAVLIPPAISILAVVLLWRYFDNIIGYLVLIPLVIVVLLMLLLLSWRKGLKEIARLSSTAPSPGRLSRILVVLLMWVFPFVAIVGLAWNELWRETWFLSALLSVLEGGIVLGVFFLFYFSYAREQENETLEHLIRLRYEITRRALSAEEIDEVYAGGVEALSRLSHPIERAGGSGTKTPVGK